jgi:molybdopterin-biosynthesis enzyme MoeA-like protein
MATRIGLIVVGDEILSGKRQDKHVPALIEKLSARGMKLAWCRLLGDDRPLLVEELKRSFASEDIVFCCGGIGGTPDDHTRQAAAEALSLPLAIQPQARGFIEERARETGREVTDIMLRMAEFPQGAGIIPNPFNRIAGFSVEQHYFVPGFPVMAHPMFDWVLDTVLQHLHFTQLEKALAMRVFGAFEAMLTDDMEAVEAQFPGVTVFSLPHVGDNTLPRHIELGAKATGAAADLVEPAFDTLKARVLAKGAQFELLAGS